YGVEVVRLERGKPTLPRGRVRVQERARVLEVRIAGRVAPGVGRLVRRHSLLHPGRDWICDDNQVLWDCSTLIAASIRVNWPISACRRTSRRLSMSSSRLFIVSIERVIELICVGITPSLVRIVGSTTRSSNPPTPRT